MSQLQHWLLCLCRQALIPLSLEGTEVGQTKAAQALAKITITSNPEMAFPGERVSVGWGWGCRAGALCGQAVGRGPQQGLMAEQQWAWAVELLAQPTGKGLSSSRAGDPRWDLHCRNCWNGFVLPWGAGGGRPWCCPQSPDGLGLIMGAALPSGWAQGSPLYPQLHGHSPGPLLRV